MSNTDEKDGDRGCHRCAKMVPIENFAEDLAGEHMAQKGRFFFYDHHFIVESVTNKSEDSAYADINKIEIGKGGWIWQMLCCIPICGPELEINKSCERRVKATSLKRVEYSTRKFDKKETLERAEDIYDGYNQAVEDTNTRVQIPFTNTDPSASNTNRDVIKSGTQAKAQKLYNVFLNNCETFTSFCVNGGNVPKGKSGENVPSKIKKGTSSQVNNGCRVFLTCFLFALVAAAYTINFYIYAIHAAKDKTFDHGGLAWGSFCTFGRNTRGFETKCDWIVFGVISSILLFCLGLYIFYLCRMSSFICKTCLKTAIITWILRLLMFVGLQIACIYLEKVLYNCFSKLGWHMAFTFLVLLVIQILNVLFWFLIPDMILNPKEWCDRLRRCRCSCRCGNTGGDPERRPLTDDRMP